MPRTNQFSVVDHTDTLWKSLNTAYVGIDWGIGLVPAPWVGVGFFSIQKIWLCGLSELGLDCKSKNPRSLWLTLTGNQQYYVLKSILEKKKSPK